MKTTYIDCTKPGSLTDEQNTTLDKLFTDTAEIKEKYLPKTYEELRNEIYSEALTEAFLDYGEDHEGDAHEWAHEAVAEWSKEFPVSTYNASEHI